MFNHAQLKLQKAMIGARTLDEKKLAMLVRIHNVDPTAYSPSAPMRAELALTTTHRQTMLMLTLDESTTVRANLLKNKGTYTDVIELLMLDPDDHISAHAVHTLNNIPR